MNNQNSEVIVYLRDFDPSLTRQSLPTLRDAPNNEYKDEYYVMSPGMMSLLI